MTDRNRTFIATTLGACVLFPGLTGCGPQRTDETIEHHVEHREERVVHLDKHKFFHAGIKVESVAKISVALPQTVPGKISLNERRVAHISARIGGRVEKVRAFTNDHMAAGQTMMELYSQEYLTSQFEFLQAAQRLKGSEDSSTDEHSTASSLYESARRKLTVLDVPGDELHRLESTQSPQSYYHVRAPFDGIVLENKVKLGEFVHAGAELFEFADLSTLWVLADIYERDLPHVRTGMKATVEVNAYPGSWNGIVSSVYSVVDERTRTVKARIEVNNSNNQLKAEMFCTVKIHTQLGKETIKVPASALLGETEKHFVFVAINDTTFEKRDIRTGVETREFAEVLDGLLEGERIVVGGGFFLKSELSKETFSEEH
jgi:membrane fusion protein, copper/silver efflux system